MITYTQMNISKKDVDLFFRIQKLINDIDEFPERQKSAAIHYPMR